MEDHDNIVVPPSKENQPVNTEHVKMGNQQDILKLVSKSINAKGYIAGDSFVVLKGSQMRMEVRKSCRDLIKKRREELVSSGKVIDYVFVEDVVFSSSSAAAGAILGGDSNGPICWENEAGVLLKQLQ